MTQTQTPVPVPTRFRVYGKDRMFDDWTAFEADYRWLAQRWLDERAWIRYDSEGEPLFEEFTPTARIRLERRNADGEWEAYTAWEGPERRSVLARSLRRKAEKWDVNNAYRIAEENSLA